MNDNDPAADVRVEDDVVDINGLWPLDAESDALAAACPYAEGLVLLVPSGDPEREPDSVWCERSLDLAEASEKVSPSSLAFVFSICSL